MSGSDMLFFRLDAAEPPQDRVLAGLRQRQQDHEVSFWQPRPGRPFPPGRLDPRVWSYSVMHAAGMFSSPHYGALILRSRDGAIDHSSLVMPRFARFPFMGVNDLQIGATFTRPEARGRGLALRAVHEIVDRFRAPDRAFWYLTDVTNRASIGVIEKAGFRLIGTGEKRPRMGLKFFGFYDMSAPAQGQSVAKRHQASSPSRRQAARPARLDALT